MRRGFIIKTIRNTVLSLSCITFMVVTGIFAAEIYMEQKSGANMKKVQAMADITINKSVSAVSAEEEVEEAQNLVALKIEYLTKKNTDLSGWLRIQGTDINYPIMFKEGDNDYYLQHDFFGNEDRNGLLVLDKRCDKDMSDNHLVIHGHNMKSGAIFGTLKYYKDQTYLKKHPAIEVDTPDEQRFYEIIAVASTSANGENGFNYSDYLNIGDRDSFSRYVDSVKARSMYKIAASANYGDQLLTLSTCDYTMKDGRLLVVAKRVG